MEVTSIREARERDAAAIAEIYRPIVELTTISFEEIAPDADEMAKRIRNVTAQYPWLVAIAGDVPVGYAYAHRFNERAGYRHSVEVSVYVRQTARGRGVGGALYSALFGRLRIDGHHRAFAGIALPNEASVALHRRFGFDLVGVYSESGRKLGRWVDVSWWQRALC